MRASPAFASPSEFAARLGDIGFWRPYLVEILARHGIGELAREPVAGFNPTYPTFLCGEVVVKLFGYAKAWRESFAAERAAQALVATDPAIAAPRLLGEGRLDEGGGAPWPYLLLSRMPGRPLHDTTLTAEERRALAAELGGQMRRIHALPAESVPALEERTPREITVAARRSSLPPHLAAQVERYLPRLGSFDRTFVHGDLVAMHAFVEGGRLRGIIDWGDATVADRHYELIQIHRDVFDCDKALLREFLEAARWPIGADFPQRALGLALHRQAEGLARHPTMDVFEPIAARLPLRELATLDELAVELFGV